MLNIRILCVGKLKERWLAEAAAEYAKRLGSYCALDISEEKEDQFDDIEEEGRRLLKKIKDGDHVITLEIEGKQLSSEALAEEIKTLALTGRSSIVFVIGGSNGLSKDVRDRADAHLSFSRMTFPHQLMRVILLEQIYRSFRIIRNEPYHK